MGENSNVLSAQSDEKDYHFAIYRHHLVITGNRMVSRQFIVMRYDNGYIRFTDFHRYVRSPINRVKHFTSMAIIAIPLLCNSLIMLSYTEI